LRALERLGPSPAGTTLSEAADGRSDVRAQFVLPGFEILGEIGHGGMGTVYRARQTRLDRVVALKRLPPIFAGNPDRLQRFRTEARAGAELSGAGIGTAYDTLEMEGGPALAV